MKTALAFAALLACAAPAAAQEVKRYDPPEKDDSVKAEITVPGARNEEEAKARLRANNAVSRCVIKPVMTDQEIADCKAAYKADSEAKQRSEKQPPAR